MGDIDRRDPCFLLDPANLCTHRDTQLGIQVGQRFVKQQDTGFQDQCSCQSNTLLLAAGQLVRHTAFHALKADKLQDVGDLFLDHCFIHFSQLQTIRDVIEDIVVG